MSSIILMSLAPKSVKYLTQIRVISCANFLRSNRVPEEALPKNLLEENCVQPKGKIYDVKPFKMKLEANKKYAWCCCGHSKSQPLCDGTHKINSLKIKINPVFFMVEESKDYWLCNCKQTLHRPFCDGTHRNNEIQNPKN